MNKPNKTLLKLLQYGFTGQTVPVALADFQSAMLAIKDIFTKYFDPIYVEQHFQLPNDYQDFLQSFSSCLIYGKYHSIYSIKEIIKGTEEYLNDFNRDFFDRKKEGCPYQTDKMWLMVGWWSDKHDLALCCDRSSPLYGRIFDIWDDHPWFKEEFVTYDDFESIDAYADFLLS